MTSTATAQEMLGFIGGQQIVDLQNLAGLAHLPLAYVVPLNAANYVWDKKTFLEIPNNIRRAPGAKFKRTSTRFTDDRYECKHYGHDEAMPVEHAKRYPNQEAATRSTLRRARHIVLLNHEMRSVDLLTGNSVPSAAPPVKWNDGGNPIADIVAAAKAIYDASGRVANTLSVPFPVHQALKLNAEIKKQISFGANDRRWEAALAALFDVERYVVASAAINGAPEGSQEVQVVPVWGDSVILSYTEAGDDLEAFTAGRTYYCEITKSQMDKSEPLDADTKNTGIYGSFHESDDKVNLIVRAEQHSDEKLCATEAVFHLSNCLV
jgi:hypothetical protein